MKKSIFIISFIMFLLIFSFSCVFANNDSETLVNNVRNAVGGAENVVEDAAKGTAGAIKDGFNTVGNKTTEDVGNNVKNMGNNAANDAKYMGDNMINDGNDIVNEATSLRPDDDYTATRTSNDTDANFMTNNVWTWIILAIIAIIIIAVIWYYATKNNTNN